MKKTVQVIYNETAVNFSGLLLGGGRGHMGAFICNAPLQLADFGTECAYVGLI